MEAEDTHFWVKEWSEMEAELLQLQAAAVGQPAQVMSANATKVAKANATQTVSAPTKLAKPGDKHYNPLAGVKLNLNPRSPADLMPALAMLKGLYEDGKERIGQLNAREKESKQRFAEKQATHEQRLNEIEARFKNGTLSKEFRTNETRDENRFWTYWERVHERQHRQYHTSLKIQHSTLERVKAMIDMYEKTISGKADNAQMSKQLAKVGGGAAPEVVLVQETQRAAARYCQEALVEIRAARAALLQTSSSPTQADAPWRLRVEE